MKTMIPEVDGASITLNGSFNPKIFQPQWFAQQGLLPQQEADDADIKIIHPQVCQFETEHFHLLVTTEQFTAATKPNTTSEPLRDLVTGTFFILEHTPVTAMGINRMMHFKVGSVEIWHRIGDNLAPKTYWTSILRGRPGLETLAISAIPEGEKLFRLNVKIEPSRTITTGVYFEINNHHVGTESATLANFMNILRDSWEEKQRAGFTIATHIIQQAGEQHE